MELRVSQKIQLLKTFSWTIISIVITTIIGWVITGDFYIGLGISIVDRIFKMASYYMHERYWHRRYKAEKKALKQ